MTTALQIAEKAIEIADQNPDFIYVTPKDPENPYADCVYVHNGEGSCLFGQAILATGAADADYLHRNKDWRIGGMLESMAHRGLIEPIESDGLLTKMTSAQIMQDNSATWADAVAELREYVGSVQA